MRNGFEGDRHTRRIIARNRRRRIGTFRAYVHFQRIHRGKRFRKFANIGIRMYAHLLGDDSPKNFGTVLLQMQIVGVSILVSGILPRVQIKIDKAQCIELPHGKQIIAGKRIHVYQRNIQRGGDFSCDNRIGVIGFINGVRHRQRRRGIAKIASTHRIHNNRSGTLFQRFLCHLRGRFPKLALVTVTAIVDAELQNDKIPCA